MEEFPLWICKVVLWIKSFLTRSTDDQKMKRGPSDFAIQKEVLWKYVALMILVRKGFLAVAIFQAA